MAKAVTGNRNEKVARRAGTAPSSGSRWEGVWVFGDLRAEAQVAATARLLRSARALAVAKGLGLSLILLGRDLESRLARVFDAGPDRICLVDHQRLRNYRQETYAWVLEGLVKKHGPEILLFLANDLGRELAPRLAARLGTGLCADCIGLGIDRETGLLVQTVPAFGDQAYANIVTPEKRPQMATVRPGTLPGEEGLPLPKRGACPVIREPLPKGLPAERVRWLGAERDHAAGGILEDARVVVCGGRGLGTKERFRTLWDLAALLKGEVGATRPAVQAHWIEEDAMIGQTGREVAPELLLLFGVSGASQFTASIGQSRTIVAVNRDPKAAVFSLADLGVVGDVGEVIPALIRKIQQTLIVRYGRSPEEVFSRAGGLVRGGVGTLLKEIRERRGYELADAAHAMQVDPSELAKIEGDDIAPSVSFLLRMAKLLRVDPAPFLSRAEGARADRKRRESFAKRTESYSYRTLTPGAEEKHLRAFHVTIDPGRDHKMVEYSHEGEEFVYVLGGEVEIRVGGELHRMGKGDTLHFEGSIPHHLRNPSRHRADLVVVLFTP